MLFALMTTLALALDPIELTLPKEDVAFWESAVVGFGAGHFYAEKPAPGAALFVVQGAGIGMLGVSRLWRTNQPQRWQNGGGPALVYAGIGALVVGRALDAALAPMSARHTARRKLAAQPPHPAMLPPPAEPPVEPWR